MAKIIFKVVMLIIFLASSAAFAQSPKNNIADVKFFLGFGAGLDYGV
jgi:hypothetical protein